MKQNFYNKKYFRDRDYLDIRMAETVKMLMTKNHLKKVLDVGCGTGRFVEFLNKNGFEAFGVDKSSDAINWSRKITKKRVFKASAVNLPFKNNSFDFVLSISLIEHLTKHEVDLFLEETSRILRKDGYIFLVTPNFMSPFRFIQGKKWFGYSDPTHINYYSPFKLSNTLKKYSFKKIELNFKTKYNIPFDWDLPNTLRAMPKLFQALLIYLLFSTPFSIIRNSFWIAARKK